MTSQAQVERGFTVDATGSTGAATDDVPVPGRWVGGLLGASASLLVGAVGLIVDPIDVGAGFSWDVLVPVGLLGAPVGWLIGRTLLPSARSGGWGTALAVGLGAGWAAPPLGAIGVLLWAGVEDGLVPMDVIGGLALLLIAVPCSFIAIFATLPAGLLWGLAVRALADDALRSLEIRGPLARFGNRHLVVLLIGASIAIGLIRGLER